VFQYFFLTFRASFLLTVAPLPILDLVKGFALEAILVALENIVLRAILGAFFFSSFMTAPTA